MTSTPPSEPAEADRIHPWLPVSTPRHGCLNLLGTLGAMFLGAIFLVAAYAKILDPTAFAQQIEQEGLAFLIPASGVALIALALEVFLGTALLLAVRRLYILLPTAALVVFFLFLTGRTYWHDMNGTLSEDATSCGCFGNLVERTPAEAFWQDLALMVPALLLAFLHRRTETGWPYGFEKPRWRMGFVGVLTAAAVLVAWKAPELPLDDLATRLKPGIDPLAICSGDPEKGNEACMDVIIGEVAEGEHLVILADLEDPAFAEAVPRLNEYTWAVQDDMNGSKPPLWIVTAASEEELFAFRLTQGPSFEIREAPPALLRPLYRTLPRSFLVRQGVVAETWSGLPPLSPSGDPGGKTLGENP